MTNKKSPQHNTNCAISFDSSANITIKFLICKLFKFAIVKRINFVNFYNSLRFIIFVL